MTSAKLLSYHRLWRTPWTIWLWLIIVSAVPILTVAYMVSSSRCPGCGFSYNLWLFQPVLLIAGALVLAGVLMGIARNINAKYVVGQAFDVSYLPATDPLAQRVHVLSDRLALPRPEVGIMSVTNAFAVGETPEQAVVILGLPLVKKLESDELDAVIGHELGHIASGDMNRMQMAMGYQYVFDGICRIVGFIFDIVLSGAAQSNSRHAAAFVAGANISKALVAITQFTAMFGSTVCIRAMSRRREFYADAVGGLLAGPDAMRRALIKIDGVRSYSVEGESTHQMLMFRGPWDGSIFATHPPLNARIAALEDGSRMRDLVARLTNEPAVAQARMRHALGLAVDTVMASRKLLQAIERYRLAILSGLIVIGTPLALGALSFWVVMKLL